MARDDESKHRSRGGISRELLASLVKEGLSIRAIGNALGFSPTAVRYWLKRHGLATPTTQRRAAGREALAKGLTDPDLRCRIHGLTRFRLEGRGAYRCLACRQERVAQRRRDLKAILVAEAGGSCVCCGYARFLGALQFHHVDPATKAFGIATEGATRSLDALRKEASKCVLVCANCHAELEGGVRTIPRAADKVVGAREGFPAQASLGRG